MRGTGFLHACLLGNFDLRFAFFLLNILSSHAGLESLGLLSLAGNLSSGGTEFGLADAHVFSLCDVALLLSGGVRVGFGKGDSGDDSKNDYGGI